MSGGAGCDRGGGRENKGLAFSRVKRSNKVNPFAKKAVAAPVILASPAAQPLPSRRSGLAIIDGGCNLASRQLTRDQARMLQRALEANVDAVICYTTDWERTSELASLVKGSPGFLYGAYGVHPDNVKRNHDKTFASRIEELRAFALAPECVAIFTGLDLGRDIASHYPQEAALTAQMRLAAELRLPTMVQETSAAERVAELAAEFAAEWAAEGAAAAAAGNDPDAAADAPAADGGSAAPASAVAAASFVPRLAVFAFDGDEKALAAFAAVDAYIMLTGAICDTSDKAAALRRDVVPRIPLRRLLLASNAPLHTPQNIADQFVRSQRNEPSNLPSVLPVLAEAWNADLPPAAPSYAAWCEGGGGGSGRPRLTPAELADVMYRNAARFYDLPTPDGVGGGGEAPRGAGAETSAAASAGDEHGDRDGGEDGEAVIAEDAAGADISLAAGIHSHSSSGAGGGVEAGGGGLTDAVVQYRCRVCREVLFSDADVMPHDGSGVKPSARAAAAAAAATATMGRAGPAAAPAANGSLPAPPPAGTAATVTAAAAAAAPSSSPPAAPADAGGSSVGEVGVSRWHTAKGKTVAKHEAGVCRALLVERMPWMTNVPVASAAAAGAAGSGKAGKGGGAGGVATEGEGSLLCPGCSAKVGQVRACEGNAWWGY